MKSDMLTTLKKQKIHVDYLSRVLAASKGRLTETGTIIKKLKKFRVVVFPL